MSWQQLLLRAASDLGCLVRGNDSFAPNLIPGEVGVFLWPRGDLEVSEEEHRHTPAIAAGMLPAPCFLARSESVNRHQTSPQQSLAAAVLYCC